MTATWVRNKATPDTELCSYYENFDRDLSTVSIPRGVYSLDDLKEYGRASGWCPYFLTRSTSNQIHIDYHNSIIYLSHTIWSYMIYFFNYFSFLFFLYCCNMTYNRHMIHHANILVYNYQYILDPKISSLVSKELESESIVVFDEAHNIDNVCIEALSVTLDKKHLDIVSITLSHNILTYTYL